MAKEQPRDRTETGTPPEDAPLRCALCEHRITERAYRRDMAGAHEHTFVNPVGLAFRISCFAAAPGCAHVGSPSAEFSWFPGWVWQIALCQRCRSHVGWIFRCGGEQFHGLITSALR